MLNRRTWMAAAAASVFAAATSAARAAVTPVVAYMDGIQPGWFIGGWSKYTQSFAFADGTKPVEVTMAGWNAFTFQTNTPLDTSAFTSLTMLTNGGAKGRQEFEVTFKKGDKVVSEPLIVRCDKGQWARTDLPLKKMKVKEPIDTIFFNNKTPDAMEPFYVNVVLFQ